MSDSSKIREDWALKDKRQFCKQSCTKISQGLDKLDNRSSERAIWELFQNARDLAHRDESGRKVAHIRITVTPDEFIFSHQGRSFTHDSFSSLVKQVSAQEKENEDSVGQYGTGFLTTHSFGRRILINGSLDMEDLVPGKYVDIDNFVIDREFDDIPSFVDKMAAQLVEIDKYADGPFTSDCRDWTELRYQLSSVEGATEKVAKGLEEALKVMPYVMTINEPIGDVVIKDLTKSRVIKFSKQQLPDENGLKVMRISIEDNGQISHKKIYYLQSADGNDTVILPLKSASEAESLSGIAKLFVFFPLLGTETFGMDAIFHSNRFIPVEERDALHLPVSNVIARSKYEANVRVLNEMSELLLSYYRQHVNEISDWHKIISLTFDCLHNKEAMTNQFFIDFKKNWVAAYEQLPIVEIDGRRQSILSGNVRVYAPTLNMVLKSELKEWQTAVYNAAKQIGRLPSEDLILEWGDTIGTWYTDNETCFISNETIAAKLSQTDCSREILLNFDKYLCAADAYATFDNFALLLNYNGEKKLKSEVSDAATIPGWLIELVKFFIPSAVAKFADREFSRLTPLTEYNRGDLRKDLNEALSVLAKDSFKKQYNPTVAPIDTLVPLAKICMIVRSSTMDNYRTKAMSVICNHLGINYSTIELPALNSDERDLTEIPFQHLTENICLEISLGNQEWVGQNIAYIHALHEALHEWVYYRGNDRNDGLAHKYAIFPNQLNEPMLASDLKIGNEIPDELMNLYQTVLGIDLRTRLVNNDFTGFIAIESLDAAEVAKEIEVKLEEEGFKRNSVLDIIDLIDTDNRYAGWFSHIAEKKAEIFMKQVNPQCKDSVYRLMKIDDPNKLNLLANLADEVNIDEILRLAKATIIKQRNEKADFDYKYNLGKYVEDLLREHLTTQLGDINCGISVEEAQCGQDLIIKLDNTIVYRLEVKSRWGTDQSVEMSPLQMRTGVAYKDAYALCCVNMAGTDQRLVEQHIYPDVQHTLSRIKVLSNIGHLASDLTEATDASGDGVHLGGNYSCIVPQKVFSEHGIEFSTLLDCIKQRCKEIAASR